jgi:pimeloyl-ACP methyl ester carboxylesterase
MLIRKPFHLMMTSIASSSSSPSSFSTSTTGMMSTVSVVDRTLHCSDGVKLACRIYEPVVPLKGTSSEQCSTDNNSKRNVLCLHGWLDNAASFHLVAPALIERHCASTVVTLDFPGHGLSSHKSSDGPVQLQAEYSFYVAEALRQLEWTNVKSKGVQQQQIGAPPLTLVGHSMGAGVSMTYTSAFPEQVDSLVLLEGFAPLARKAKDVSQHLRTAIETRQSYNPRLYPELGESDTGTRSTSNRIGSGSSMGRIYPNIATAIDSRMHTAKLSPGNQYISQEAARLLVERATVSASSSSQDDNTTSKLPASVLKAIQGASIKFRHDSRLNWPNLQYYCHEQVMGLLEAVQESKVPVCLLQAQDGWPVDETAMSAVSDTLQPTYHPQPLLPGSHHNHADPNDAPAVIGHVEQFLKSLPSSSSTSSSCL